MPIICRLFGCVHQLLLSLSASVGETSWASRSCRGSHKVGAAYLLSRTSEERNSGNLCSGFELFFFLARLSIFLLDLLEGFRATRISDEHGLRRQCEMALDAPPQLYQFNSQITARVYPELLTSFIVKEEVVHDVWNRTAPEFPLSAWVLCHTPVAVRRTTAGSLTSWWDRSICSHPQLMKDFNCQSHSQ